MNSAKVKNSLGPFLVVIGYILASLMITTAVEPRNWQAIMLFTTVELFAFYVISNAKFNLNKTRVLCLILAVQILFHSLPYTLAAWGYVNLKAEIAATIFDAFYESYVPFSIVISSLLAIVSLSPPRIFDDIAKRIRIDSYLLRINMFCGLYIFSVDAASLK